MNFKQLMKSLIPASFLAGYKRRNNNESSGAFLFESDSPADVKQDICEKYGHNSDLLELFVRNSGHVVHKWHHYIPIYDRYFSPYRNRNVRFLEIGVSEGGSLQLWRKYFGENAVIFGVDINPKCAKLNGKAGQVRIGSQTDRAFLEAVIEEMGGVDIILDDGSHHMDHVRETIECLFPRLSYGGIYMVEDLHTAYWRKFGGGYSADKNFFRYVLHIVNDMHHWYHSRGAARGTVSKDCSGVHVHDSIVVFEKNRVYRPVNSKIG